MTFSSKQKAILLGGVSFFSLLVISLLDPIPQDPKYHNFADKHSFFGIPNFCNVISNMPFAFVALWAFFWRKKLNFQDRHKKAYLLFFSGIFFVSLGSFYYHWEPSNATLLWDRLPMTIAFMAFFSIVLSEYINAELGEKLLYPLLAIGLLSVGYWYYSELQGQGDLRAYVAVQFLPIILLPIIFLLYPSPYSHAKKMWLILIAYGLAKILEHFDHEIYQIFGELGGHPLKHVAAACGPLIFLFILRKRKRINSIISSK